MKNQIFKFLTVFVISGGLLLSCTDSTTNSSDSAPTVPSEQSMTIDLSDFNNDSQQKVKAGSNFNAAIFRAGIAKLIVDANLAIPKFLVASAQNKEAEEIAEGTYQWNYSTQNNEGEFSVRLTADLDADDDVEWRFDITTDVTDPPLNGFVLFSGEADFDGTDGEWMYYDPNETGPVSSIEWDVDEDGSVDLDFSVLSDRNGNEGSEIDYDFDGTVKTLVYVDGTSEEKTIIEFNTETKAGFIISPNYNEGVKSCWDDNFDDIPCNN